jgi:nitrogen-specific signal transduction histidine kinase
MAARSRVKRSLKTRVKRGAKAPARTSRAGKKTAPKKAGPGQIAAKKPARKLPAKRPAKRPETESGIVEAALAAFAHEVRTPLTGILAISSLLATSELGEREKRWVDTIKVGAEHLAALATLFVDRAQRQHRAVRASGFLRSAHPVANAGRLACRACFSKGLAIAGYDRRGFAGFCNR